MLNQGKEMQNELALNLMDFGARYFDVAIGRWTSQDPVNQFSNPYIGMGNDPVNGIDPDGRKEAKVLDRMPFNHGSDDGESYNPYANGGDNSYSSDFSESHIFDLEHGIGIHYNDNGTYTNRWGDQFTVEQVIALHQRIGDFEKYTVTIKDWYQTNDKSVHEYTDTQTEFTFASGRTFSIWTKNTEGSEPFNFSSLNSIACIIMGIKEHSRFSGGKFGLGTWLGKNGEYYLTEARPGKLRPFFGNQYTGSLKAAEEVANSFKKAGTALGIVNYGLIYMQYQSHEINSSQLYMEETSNTVGTFGGIYGLAWSLGWEGGRKITETSTYENWKYDTWLPWRKKHWGY
jgi:RHS repeat-associated protein